MNHLLLYNNFINEKLGRKIYPLYHGSGTLFDNFSPKTLGEDQHILSYLGYHFTPDYELADRLFTKPPNYVVYTIELKINKTLKIIEGDLVRDMLIWGSNNNFFDSSKVDVTRLTKMKYYSSGDDGTISTCLWVDKNRIINKKKLALGYKKHLIKEGYDSIQYLNEIEWASDKRYDWIVFNSKQIKIINIYKKDSIKLNDEEYINI